MKKKTKSKVDEIRKSSNDELEAKIKEHKSELFNLRFSAAINKLTNPMRIRFLKKEIARIYTVLTERRSSLTV